MDLDLNVFKKRVPISIGPMNFKHSDGRWWSIYLESIHGEYKFTMSLYGSCEYACRATNEQVNLFKKICDGSGPKQKLSQELANSIIFRTALRYPNPHEEVKLVAADSNALELRLGDISILDSIDSTYVTG